jgi:hypothetical protein
MADLIGPTEGPEQAPLEYHVLRWFGQNVSGITIHSDDWENEVKS